MSEHHRARSTRVAALHRQTATPERARTDDQRPTSGLTKIVNPSSLTLRPPNEQTEHPKAVAVPPSGRAQRKGGQTSAVQLLDLIPRGRGPPWPRCSGRTVRTIRTPLGRWGGRSWYTA